MKMVRLELVKLGYQRTGTINTGKLELVLCGKSPASLLPG